jgi:hypothetical protein
MNDLNLDSIPVLQNLNGVTLKTLVILLVCLIMYDFISTYVCVVYFDNLIEGNPLSKLMSLPMFFFLKLLCTFGGLFILISMYQYVPVTVNLSFFILIILYTIVFLNNTYALGCAL